MQILKEANSTTQIGKKLFFTAYVILLLRVLLETSMLMPYLNVESTFYRYVLRYFAYILIGLKILSQDRFSLKVLVAYLFLGIFYIVGRAVNSAYGLFDLFILAVGAHGIELKSIVKTYFWLATSVCVMLFVFSICGIIENYKIYAGDIPRYSFGKTYPTDFAAGLFYIQLSHAYIRKKDYSFFTFAFWVLVAIFVFEFCRARLNFAMILSFAIFMYAKALFPKVLHNRVVQGLVVWAIPAILVFSIVLHWAYSPNSTLLTWLDGVLSGRLYYGHRAIEDYGFSLFGQNIRMQGWGFTFEEWDAELGYYFIDCGWLNMALRFGTITTVLVCASFMIVSRNAFRNSDFVLPIIMLFLAITSIVDHHVLEIGYNPFLVAIGLAARQICANGSKNKSLSALERLNTRNQGFSV